MKDVLDCTVQWLHRQGQTNCRSGRFCFLLFTQNRYQENLQKQLNKSLSKIEYKLDCLKEVTATSATCCQTKIISFSITNYDIVPLHQPLVTPLLHYSLSSYYTLTFLSTTIPTISATMWCVCAAVLSSTTSLLRSLTLATTSHNCEEYTQLLPEEISWNNWSR